MTKLSAVILVFMASGCVSLEPAPEDQKFERVYPYTMGEVWAAAVTVMDRNYFILPDPTEHMIVTTEWNWDIERDVQKGTPQEINWKERYKLTVTLQTAREGILITLTPWVEQQAPSRYGGIRWVRKATDGQREQRILSQIGLTLIQKRG